jgi:hypothetical protein
MTVFSHKLYLRAPYTPSGCGALFFHLVNVDLWVVMPCGIEGRVFCPEDGGRMFLQVHPVLQPLRTTFISSPL